MRDQENILKLDAEAEADQICDFLRSAVSRTLKRQGAVVAISGGIDSSLTAALAVRALGKERVIGLIMPERESSPDSSALGKLLAEFLGIRTECQDISGILDSAGCYALRDAAFRETIPGYGAGWKSKIVLSPLTEVASLRFFYLIALSPDGEEYRQRLSAESYLQVVAATNFKQRVRKMLEYYYADRNNYAVLGTPNLLEYDQGFFVKLGDGAADVKPIAHLYKTQVFQLAEHLGIPEVILSRYPTTDTYSMPQSQEEFYFSLPYDKMDVCLYGKNHGMTPAEVGQLVGLSCSYVERVYLDIDQKRRTGRYLHEAPMLFTRPPVLG
jgi:NAD+ synthase